MYTESTIKPEFKEQYPGLIRINFDITEEERTDPQTEDAHTIYCYQSIEVSQSADYATIVSAIVRSKYSEDAVEAIILNGTDTEEHTQDLAELQTWRSHAKEVARMVIG